MNVSVDKMEQIPQNVAYLIVTKESNTDVFSQYIAWIQ